MPESLILSQTSAFQMKSWTYWAVQWSWFAQVNALRNLSRKKSREVAVSLLGRFLSRRCFTLCITMEVEPRIAKQYKCHHCCNCKKSVPGKRGGGLKKKCLWRFLADQKMASSWEKKRVLGHPIAQAHTACCQTHSDDRPPKMPLNFGSVKITNSLSPPSIVKKVHTGSKSSQGN